MRLSTLLAVATLSVAAPAVAQAAQPSPYLTVEQLRAKFADKDSKFANIGGVEIHYKDEGKGPVLLMVHGSQSSLRTWDGVVAKLKDRYRIIRYDVAGQGLSGNISDEAAATLKPTDIAEGLLKQLGVTKLKAGVGVSSGGTLIAFLASGRPDLVERAILSNMPSDPVVTTHLKQPQAFLDAQARAKANKVTDLDYWNQFLSYFSGDPARISPAKRQEYADYNRREPNKNLIALTAQIRDGKESTATFAAMTTPALLIWGGSDQLLPVPAADRLQQYLTKSEVSRVILPDVGHYPPLEVPDRFADIMAAYIESGVPNLPKP
ncbi:alpha/beta fold hydrolase [Sandaracinobacteroides hominis]|uniref:alpha/beta fold hydrolase n=1 Tax=Sandaracinobacteroides hominis TaxID=2780086 RepID=UPI0018F5BA97|nr:alpha/beta hydrolase [Sandaracinobacteroides hominis]